jgi:hypothetical protein
MKEDCDFSLLKYYELLLLIKPIFHFLKKTNDECISKYGNDFRFFNSYQTFELYVLMYYNTFLHTKNKKQILYESNYLTDYQYFVRIILRNKLFSKYFQNIISKSDKELDDEIKKIKNIGRNRYIISLIYKSNLIYSRLF